MIGQLSCHRTHGGIDMAMGKHPPLYIIFAELSFSKNSVYFVNTDFKSLILWLFYLNYKPVLVS